MVKKMNKNKKKDLHHWADPLLQGLAFWLGYEQQITRNYELTEGAIFAEAVKLIRANLYKNEKLHTEKMYKDLGLKNYGQERVDIVVSDEDGLISAMEVKRNIKDFRLIKKDFERLMTLKRRHKESKCFLLLVSQSVRPKRYVNDKGTANKIDFIGKDYIAHVKRVCKASSTFRSKAKAHYVCLIEVLPKNK